MYRTTDDVGGDVDENVEGGDDGGGGGVAMYTGDPLGLRKGRERATLLGEST